MSPLATVVLVVLVDLLGFTIVMPLLAPFAQEYGFSGLQIGLLLAAFPLCQLIAGPILGRLSDRYGRRPVLIVSQAGTALSFLILGLTQNFWIMLIARAVDGASGGNILVAQAYVADVTPPEQRARGLGLIGMAFGLGFVLGPLMGGLLLELPVAPEWRLRLPFLVAAGFSTLAWVLVLLRLPESRKPGAEGSQARVATWRGVLATLSLPSVRVLVLVGALATLAFAALEGTYSLYVRSRLDWGPRQAAFAFAFLGVVSAVVQGGLIRGLVRRHGEPALIVAGLAIVAAGMAGLAVAQGVAMVLAVTALVGLGQGLVSPSLSGLLSRVTPDADQGAVFGTLASAQTLARMVNYLVANVLLARADPSAPYWEGAAVASAALVIALVASRTDSGVARRLARSSSVMASGRSRWSR